MHHDHDYSQTLNELRDNAEAALASPLGVFFNTQIRKSLYAKYLESVARHSKAIDGDEGELKKGLTCSYCARFMSRMGSVVTSNGLGIQSVYWNPDVVTDPVMKEVVRDMKQLVEESRIVSIFNPEGPYSSYVETTDYQGKAFSHYFVPHNLLVARSVITGRRIDVKEQIKRCNRVGLLIRFAGELSYTTLMQLDQLFQSGDIKHINETANTLESLKALMTSVNTLKHSEGYKNAKSDWHRETLLTNLVWRYAISYVGLISARNSSLGTVLLKMEKALNGTPEEAAQANKMATGLWKEMTHGLNHRRTKTPASDAKIEQTLMFLQDNDYMASLEQVEASVSDLPLRWKPVDNVFKKPAEEAKKTSSFADFAKERTAQDKGDDDVMVSSALTDVGYFFNELMPHVESMGFRISMRAQFTPMFFNRQASLESKRIFKWDQSEPRCPFVMYAFASPFAVQHMACPGLTVEESAYMVPVVAMTSPHTIGIETRDGGQSVVFLLGHMKSPVNPRPALFSDVLIGELYEHRRSLEDYSGQTEIQRVAEGDQQALGFPIGQFDPKLFRQHSDQNYVQTYVRFSDAYAAQTGKKWGIFKLSLDGFKIDPKWDQFPVINSQWLNPAPVEEVAEAELPDAAGEGEQPPAEGSMQRV